MFRLSCIPISACTSPECNFRSLSGYPVLGTRPQMTDEGLAKVDTGWERLQKRIDQNDRGSRARHTTSFFFQSNLATAISPSFSSSPAPLSLAEACFLSAARPASRACGRISQVMEDGSMCTRKAGSNEPRNPLAKASASTLPERGDQSTCTFRSIFFIYAASSISTALAGNFVVMSLSRAAPLPLLSVQVGATRTRVRWTEGISPW